jgi:hypothetical protein
MYAGSEQLDGSPIENAALEPMLGYRSSRWLRILAPPDVQLHTHRRLSLVARLDFVQIVRNGARRGGCKLYRFAEHAGRSAWIKTRCVT